MDRITSISDLRNAIVKLETEQEVKGQLLRQQFQLTYESLKPVNLLKSAVHDISSTPHLTSKLLGMTTGLGLGYLTRKLVIGASVSIYVKVIGSIVQLGGTLKVNALAAIISIIVGATVWGVAGMILFLPIAAMLKVVCQEYEELKPIALFIGEQSVKEKTIEIEIIGNLKKTLITRFHKRI